MIWIYASYWLLEVLIVDHRMHILFLFLFELFERIVEALGQFRAIDFAAINLLRKSLLFTEEQGIDTNGE